MDCVFGGELRMAQEDSSNECKQMVGEIQNCHAGVSTASPCPFSFVDASTRLLPPTSDAASGI